jgi:hypothetical protein
MMPGKEFGMFRKALIAFTLVLFAAVPLSAELKYTLHMEAKAAANAANDPMSMMAGGMITQMFPPGGIDQEVLVGDAGMRTEQKHEFAGMKAGTVTLAKADGTMYVIDPSTKTYWKQAGLPAEAAEMFAQMSPKVTVGPRGVFEMVDGKRCEKISVTMTMAIPGVDPSQLPPGMPAEISMAYDMWMTDEIKMPKAPGAAVNVIAKQFGLDRLEELKQFASDGRMNMKTVMTMFGVEMTMTTRNVNTAPAPAGAFEVPKDYKEVPPPGR